MTHCLRKSKLFVCKITCGEYSFLNYIQAKKRSLKIELEKKRSQEDSHVEGGSFEVEGYLTRSCIYYVARANFVNCFMIIK